MTDLRTSPPTTVLPPIRLLVVDDSELDRELLVTSLRSCDDAVEIVEAATGADALGCLSDDAFDAVFLDLRMPGVNGLEVAAVIAEAPPAERPHVYMWSSIGDRLTVDRCIRSGATAHYLKPDSLTESRRIIGRLLDALRAGLDPDPGLAY